MEKKITCNSLLINSNKDIKTFNNNHIAPLIVKGSTVIEKDLLVNGKIKIGSQIFHYKPTLNFNITFGHNTLQNNTSGSNNVAIGHYTLHDNTDGSNNTGVGYYALSSNTTGNWNTAIGASSLIANTTGFANTAFGNLSLATNVSGNNNVAIGSNSLVNNKLSDNIGIGSNALKQNNGSQNIAIGSSALDNRDDCKRNVCIGYLSGYNVNLSDYLSGSDNVCIGNNTSFIVDTSPSNQIIIGSNAVGHGDNVMVIGGTGESVISDWHPAVTNVTNIGSDTYKIAKIYSSTVICDNLNSSNVICDKLNLVDTFTPSNASTTGVKGDFRFDKDYLYMCVSTNTWKRVKITTL